MRRRLWVSLFVLVSAFVIGVIGYSILLNLPILDAFYFTVVTISTVGYGEIYPATPASRVFTSILIIVSLGSLAIFLETFSEEILRRSIIEVVGKPVIKKPLENHYIVCGYGDIGRVIVEELMKTGESYVVIDEDEKVVQELIKKGVSVIHGDALKEETLKEAGIMKAKGIATAFGEDIQNVFLVITAKALNPRIYAVARVNHVETIDKMYKVGADIVISPEVEGGRMIAKALVKPFILNIIDRMVLSRDVDAIQFYICPHSELEGKTMEAAKIETKTGVKVVALTHDGKVKVMPSSDTVLSKGDVLLLIGNKEQIEKFRKLFQERSV